MADFKAQVTADIGGAVTSILSSWWDSLTNVNRLESPLETAFLQAAYVYFALATSLNAGVMDTVEEGRDAVRSEKNRLAIIPQAKLLDYRVDFLFIFLRGDVLEEIVIECDGHEFHERTKEQASRDKARDRALQVSGYKVFRFSGSDIYASAWGCGAEIGRYVASQIEAAS